MEMGNSIAETQKEKSRETCFSSRKGEFTVYRRMSVPHLFYNC